MLRLLKHLTFSSGLEGDIFFAYRGHETSDGERANDLVLGKLMASVFATTDSCCLGLLLFILFCVCFFFSFVAFSFLLARVYREKVGEAPAIGERPSAGLSTRQQLTGPAKNIHRPISARTDPPE